MNWKHKIVNRYGQEYIFRQLAEECAELAHASLKLIRAQNNETLVSVTEAKGRLIEEMADVLVMSGIVLDAVLTAGDIRQIEEMGIAKEKRMQKRMLDGNCCQNP